MRPTLAGRDVTRVALHVPATGVWLADVELLDPAALSGRVSLVIGDVTFTGTIDAQVSGTAHETLSRYRVVAGAGRWGAMLPPRGYHNDAGLRASVVLQDVARDAGETITDLPTTVLGVDYVRSAGPGSACLTSLAPEWWVGTDGTTHGTPRPTTPAATGSYRVLSFDPRSRIAELEATTDSLAPLLPGSVLSARLPEAMPVRALDVEVTASGFVARAELGSGPPRLQAAFSSLLARQQAPLTPYRVLRMVGDRVELQATRPTSDPDLGPISLFPGMAGLHASLTPGAEVLVAFVNGDRSQPVVTHFRGKDGSAWAPVSLTLDASTEIKLGANATETVAFASRVLSELAAIQATIESLVITGSATGEFTVPYVAPSSASEIGSTKTKAE